MSRDMSQEIPAHIAYGHFLHSLTQQKLEVAKQNEEQGKPKPIEKVDDDDIPLSATVGKVGSGVDDSKLKYGDFFCCFLRPEPDDVT